MRQMRTNKLLASEVRGLRPYDFVTEIESRITDINEHGGYNPRLAEHMGLTLNFAENSLRVPISENLIEPTFPVGILGQALDDIVEARNSVFGQDAKMYLALVPTFLGVGPSSVNVGFELSVVMDVAGYDDYLDLDILTYPKIGNIRTNNILQPEHASRIEKVYVDLKLERFEHRGGVFCTLDKYGAISLINNLLVAGFLPYNHDLEKLDLEPDFGSRQKSATK
jgi:hypothetical protein